MKEEASIRIKKRTGGPGSSGYDGSYRLFPGFRLWRLSRAGCGGIRGNGNKNSPGKQAQTTAVSIRKFKSEFGFHEGGKHGKC